MKSFERLMAVLTTFNISAFTPGTKKLKRMKRNTIAHALRSNDGLIWKIAELQQGFSDNWKRVDETGCYENVHVSGTSRQKK